MFGFLGFIEGYKLSGVCRELRALFKLYGNFTMYDLTRFPTEEAFIKSIGQFMDIDRWCRMVFPLVMYRVSESNEVGMRRLADRLIRCCMETCNNTTFVTYAKLIYDPCELYKEIWLYRLAWRSLKAGNAKVSRELLGNGFFDCNDSVERHMLVCIGTLRSKSTTAFDIFKASFNKIVTTKLASVLSIQDLMSIGEEYDVAMNHKSKLNNINSSNSNMADKLVEDGDDVEMIGFGLENEEQLNKNKANQSVDDDESDMEFDNEEHCDIYHAYEGCKNCFNCNFDTNSRFRSYTFMKNNFMCSHEHLLAKMFKKILQRGGCFLNYVVDEIVRVFWHHGKHRQIIKFLFCQFLYSTGYPSTTAVFLGKAQRCVIARTWRKAYLSYESSELKTQLARYYAKMAIEFVAEEINQLTEPKSEEFKLHLANLKDVYNAGVVSNTIETTTKLWDKLSSSKKFMEYTKEMARELMGWLLTSYTYSDCLCMDNVIEKPEDEMLNIMMEQIDKELRKRSNGKVIQVNMIGKIFCATVRINSYKLVKQGVELMNLTYHCLFDKTHDHIPSDSTTFFYHVVQSYAEAHRQNDPKIIKLLERSMEYNYNGIVSRKFEKIRLKNKKWHEQWNI